MATKAKRIVWRDQYDPVQDEAAGAASVVELGGEELTEQHHAADLDINAIVQRYANGAPAPEPMPLDRYRDLTHAPDLRTILDKGRAAQEAFNSWPAELREKFGYSPAKAFAWVMDPQNGDEAVRLGLLQREEPAKAPEPMAVKIVDPEGSQTRKPRASSKQDTAEDE